MKKADKESLKINNKLVILHELNKWDLSRSEIAGITGLSNSTVSSLICELIEDNLVFEKDVAKSTGGRKPIILSLNESAAFVLVIKILPHQIKAAIINLKQRIINSQSCTFADCSEQVIKENIKNIVCILLEKKIPAKSKLIGIGISTPGLVDHATGNIIYSSYLHLNNFNIKQYIHSIVCCDNIYIFKDVDAFMLGTYTLNHLKSNASYLYFLVDSGVGLSFLSNGRIMQLNRSGMEIGHVQLESDGPICICGKKGCVETFVSESAAQKRYSHLCEKEKSSDKITLSELVFKSNRGDAVSRKVLCEQCEYLGRAIALAVNIFAPNEIFIGGPLAKIKWNAIDIIEKVVKENILSNFSDISIKFFNTAEDSDFAGMAYTVFDREFYCSLPFSY